MLISDLLVKIGVDADVSKVKQFEAGITKVTKVVAVADAALAGMAGGLTAFVQKSLEGLDEIAQLSRVTGEATDNIQILGTIAETAGSSVQASNNSIEGLSRTIGEAANGVGLGARAFENYGLSAKKANGDIKSATEVMEELRGKMRGMSEQQQIAMLAKLGIDKSMIQVLRMTNEEMAEARKNAEALTLGTGSQKGADEAAALQDSLTQVAQVVRAVSEYVALQLSPAIREAVEVFKNWFVVNNEIIKENLAGFANGIATFFKFISSLAKAIDNVIRNTVGWKVALAAVATVMGILSASSIAAMGPIYAIIGAVSAFFLLVDDLLTYMDGGESALGDFWEPFANAINFIKPYFMEWVELIKATISNLVTSVREIVGGIVSIFTNVFSLVRAILGGDIEGIKTSFSGLVAGIGKTFGGVVGVITAPFQAAFDVIKKLVAKFLDPVMDKIKKVKSYFGFGEDEEETTTEEADNNKSDVQEENEKIKPAKGKKGLLASAKESIQNAGEVVEAAKEKVSEYLDSAKNIVSGWFNFGDVAANAQAFNPETIASKAKAGAVGTKVENKANTNNVTTTISVTGVSNPQETAAAVSDASGKIVKNVESLQAI